MRSKYSFLLCLFFCISFSINAYAESQEREVPSFSEISLRVSGKLFVKQGSSQNVEISASASSLDEIITEVRDRTLNIRFKTRNLLLSSFDPGKIEITVTVPEINSLSVAGSGDIIADGPIASRIIDLSVSGSGNIFIDELNSERVKTTVSGSGDIVINGGAVVQDMSVIIGGSGNVKAGRYEAANVDIKIAGSGNCNVYTNGNLKARVAVRGMFTTMASSIDTSILGVGDYEKR